MAAYIYLAFYRHSLPSELHASIQQIARCRAMHAAPLNRCSSCGKGSGYSPGQNLVRAGLPAKRAPRHLQYRPLYARRCRRGHVQRRLEERAAGQDRLRSPLRAHDVKGSRNVADGQHWSLLEKAGGRAGSDINGTTAWDRTNYFEQVPSNQLELALWLESDRMGTLIETLTQAKLDNQREVVKNERRQRVDNQPYGTWWEKMLGYVFPDAHPYRHSVLGSMTDLTNASIDDVKSFFRTYYAPNNAVLVIAGDIDINEAKQLVEKHFGDIPRGPTVPPQMSMSAPPLIGKEAREVVRDQNASAPAVYIGYRVPAARDKRGPTVDLISDALAGGPASPLYKSLVREKQIAVGVSGFNFSLIDGADVLVFTATGKANTNPDSLEAALVAELDKATSTINQALLDRARTAARFQLVNALQTTGGFGGRADALAEGYTYYRDPK